MIFDRTLEDVNEARRIVRDVIINFAEPTEEELERLSKGIIGTSTINRIESKQREIMQGLNESGYWSNRVDNKTNWRITDFFMKDDLERLANNTETLRRSFYVYSDTPNNPKPIYHYEEINKMEKILFDLSKMIDFMKNNFRECGTFDCGE